MMEVEKSAPAATSSSSDSAALVPKPSVISWPQIVFMITSHILLIVIIAINSATYSQLVSNQDYLTKSQFDSFVATVYAPTAVPTTSPPSAYPTGYPTVAPTISFRPTAVPTTAAPTASFRPTAKITASPTLKPVTLKPVTGVPVASNAPVASCPTSVPFDDVIETNACASYETACNNGNAAQCECFAACEYQYFPFCSVASCQQFQSLALSIYGVNCGFTCTYPY